MGKSVFLFACLVLAFAAADLVGAPPTEPPAAKPSDPGRVSVRTTAAGKTVVGDQGERLRGASVAVFKNRRESIGTFGAPTDYAIDPEFYDRMEAAKLNVVRVAFFDGWQRSHIDPNGPIGRRFAGCSVNIIEQDDDDDDDDSDEEDDDEPLVRPRFPFPYMPLLVEDVFYQFLTDPNAPNAAAQAQLVLDRERDELLGDLDTIVDLAGERGIYVVINFHDVFNYHDPDFCESLPETATQFNPATTMDYLNAFWDLVAPRYKDRTHVLYELANEPVPFHPNDVSGQNVDDFIGLYERVRNLAPQTHLILGSFTTVAHFGDRSMLTIARELDDGDDGVDFDNASIGFHGYDVTDALPFDESYITALANEYAVINTEINLPGSRTLFGDPPAPGYLPSETFSHESMERLNISWIMWNTTGEELPSDLQQSTGAEDEFEYAIEVNARADAEEKGYLWDDEIDQAKVLDGYRDSSSLYFQYLYPRLAQYFAAATFF
ncbi:MAG: cellulase family glycosylhydrolase [Planctomycetota bacterium]